VLGDSVQYFPKAFKYHQNNIHCTIHAAVSAQREAPAASMLTTKVHLYWAEEVLHSVCLSDLCLRFTQNRNVIETSNLTGALTGFMSVNLERTCCN